MKVFRDKKYPHWNIQVRKWSEMVPGQSCQSWKLLSLKFSFSVTSWSDWSSSSLLSLPFSFCEILQFIRNCSFAKSVTCLVTCVMPTQLDTCNLRCSGRLFRIFWNIPALPVHFLFDFLPVFHIFYLIFYLHSIFFIWFFTCIPYWLLCS